MKIFRATGAFYARRREGPYRFMQNRLRTSVVALKSGAAAEKSKDRPSRFLGLFDFRFLQQYLPCADINHHLFGAVVMTLIKLIQLGGPVEVRPSTPRHWLAISLCFS